jgi:hypothetical protein
MLSTHNYPPCSLPHPSLDHARSVADLTRAAKGQLSFSSSAAHFNCLSIGSRTTILCAVFYRIVHLVLYIYWGRGNPLDRILHGISAPSNELCSRLKHKKEREEIQLK